MAKYTDKLGSFAERLKSGSTEAPLQEVKPLEQKPTLKAKTEVQLNIWVPKSLMKNIKQYSIDSEKSIKDLVTEALAFYLNRK